MKVAQLAAMTEEAINKSAAITIGNWWNQSGPSAQPKTKSRVAQKQAGRRWSTAEEQAAKRTNKESPPGGGGHVASNNRGAVGKMGTNRSSPMWVLFCEFDFDRRN